MGLTAADYRHLLATARRYRIDDSEAEDILQDALIVAVAAGRDDAGRLDNRRWIVGVIRNKAKLVARGSRRRRARDVEWARTASSNVPDVDPGAVLPELAPALKAVAALALSGHSRREIAYLLGLDDAALRQRIVQLKRRLVGAGLSMPGDLPGLNLDLAYGRIRAALLPLLQRQQGALATHDPDGHLFVVRRSQKP